MLRITLEPVAGGTRMVLEHTGFRGVKALLVSLMMGSGWKGIVRKHIPGVLDRMRDDGTLRPRAEGDHR